MSQTTGIEWTDATWNPTRGCTRVSDGCRNCYAEKVAYRFSDAGQAYHGLVGIGGRWNGKVTLAEDRLLDPLKWKKPRRIFVDSMSDLFHEAVPDAWIASVFSVMEQADQHSFQLLTKRPERALAWLSTWTRPPLPNVWLGVSVEDQATADERIPLLLRTPAALRFISAEPLLGPLDIYSGDPDPRLGGHVATATYLGDWYKPGELTQRHGLDWVIAGGESGPGARPMQSEWALSLRDQCVAAEVPFFFKQWGEWLGAMQDGGASNVVNASDVSVKVGKKRAGSLLDGREWKQFPEDKMTVPNTTLAAARPCTSSGGN